MKRFRFAIFALCIVYVVLMALSVCVESVSDMLSSREHFNKMNCGGFDKTNDYLDDVPPHPNDYKNFANQYFRNLTYYGYNSNGTCAYIALGMVLSYFDTYWNDTIIPERYDKTASIDGTHSYDLSPGIDDEKSSFNNDFKYLNYMLTKTSSNFHAYLLSLGNSLGYTNSGLGLYLYQLYEIFKKYGNVNGAVNNDNFTYVLDDRAKGSTASQADLKSSIKTYMKLGIPVIVHIQGYRKGSLFHSGAGHAIVAYDYDEENDTIYGHFGLGGEYMHQNILSEVNGVVFDEIVGYLVINPFRSEHYHSNNYVMSAYQTLCACQLITHEHKLHYKDKLSNSHTEYCYCGYSQVESHTFLPDAIGKFDICTKCNYRKKSDGGFVPIPGVSIVDEVEMMQNEMDQTEYIVAA